VQVSCTAPISAIPVRSPSHGSEGCDRSGGPSVAGRAGSSFPVTPCSGRRGRRLKSGHPRQGNRRSQGISWPAVRITRSRVSDFGSPLGANTGNGEPLGPSPALLPLAPSRCCDNFLYGFKGGLATADRRAEDEAAGDARGTPVDARRLCLVMGLPPGRDQQRQGRGSPGGGFGVAAPSARGRDGRGRQPPGLSPRAGPRMVPAVTNARCSLRAVPNGQKRS
jgi:hypothetical protein